MSRSDSSWPYYIQSRRISFFGRLWGWVSYSEYNAYPKSIKTFEHLESAIAHVHALINYDNRRDAKVINKQVWPDDDEGGGRVKYLGDY